MDEQVWQHQRSEYYCQFEERWDYVGKFLLDGHSISFICSICNNVSAAYKSWRQALRRVWKVSYNCHTTIIYALSNNIPVFDIICKRSLNFIKSCLASNNDVVNFIARCGVHSSRIFFCIVTMVSFDLTNVQWQIYLDLTTKQQLSDNVVTMWHAGDDRLSKLAVLAKAYISLA